MKRYISVNRSASGGTTVTKTYIGHIESAVRSAENLAKQQLEALRLALEPAIAEAS